MSLGEWFGFGWHGIVVVICGFWFCVFSGRLVLLVAAGSDGFGFAWIGCLGGWFGLGVLWALWFVGVLDLVLWLGGWQLGSVGYCVDVCCAWFAFCMLIGRFCCWLWSGFGFCGWLRSCVVAMMVSCLWVLAGLIGFGLMFWC